MFYLKVYHKAKAGQPVNIYIASGLIATW